MARSASMIWRNSCSPPGKSSGRETVFGPADHFRAAEKPVRLFPPLIGNFPDHQRFSLYFHGEHVVVIQLVDGMFFKQRVRSLIGKGCLFSPS
jgi:hypothetical protein